MLFCAILAQLVVFELCMGGRHQKRQIRPESDQIKLNQTKSNQILLPGG
jgi:hypothetical protein